MRGKRAIENWDISCFAFGAGVVLTPGRAAADSFTFSLIPANGVVSGPAGTTVGCGYSITNDSSSDWLVTTNLAAGSLLNATPTLPFDFPTLGPGQTVTKAFTASTEVGFYKLTWNTTAPAGFTNTGNFDLSAQWWNGNPTNGGSLIVNAPDVLDAYSASVGRSTSTVPEPSLVLLIGAGLLAAATERARTGVRRAGGRSRRRGFGSN